MRNTDRSEKLTVIDIVCITNFRVLPSHLITLLPVMLVTTREWLSPLYNEWCYDRRGEEKNTPPKAFQVDETKSSTWIANKRSAVLLCNHFGFCSSRKGNHKTWGEVNVVVGTG